MDPRDLKAASKYVNNLLASRGLLRGKEIAFHKPTEDDTTPSKVINLVHELLTRRDKEEEQRESLALTIRTLRNTETTQGAAITQLKTKNADLERKTALLESAHRNYTSSLRTAEAASRALKDEVVRIKTTLSQVRTQCANDIRKRDMQIQKMKERLSDTRGRGTRPPMAQCTVIGGPSNLAGSLSSSRRGTTVAEDESKTLAQDTTDFLTKLSQDLADENDNLIALVRTTLSTLKAIQGLPDDDHFLPAEVEVDGSEGVNPVISPPASFENLTAELDNVMYSLKEVLNQPNYVPLEDLAERDAEIERLVAKNTTLEEEWRKAIELVDGWNKTLGAKFAEVTKEGDGVSGRSPRRTPGRGRALMGAARGRDAEESEEDEGVAVAGWGRGGNELSIVEEETERDEEIIALVHESPAEEGRNWESHTPGPTVEPIVGSTQGEEIAPESQSTPMGGKRKHNAKATKNDVSTRMEETVEEAATEEQVLAEAYAAQTRTQAKTPAKKGKRKVRISEATPEMFEPIETTTEEVEGDIHESRMTPVGREAKQKAKDGSRLNSQHEDILEIGITQEEETAEEPQASSARKDEEVSRKDDNLETTHEDTQEVRDVSQVQAPHPKRDRKRKAPQDITEMIEDSISYDSAIVAEARRGRERKRRARKEDVIIGDEMPESVQNEEILPEEQPVEALRRRDRGRARKKDVTMDADMTGVTDMTEGMQDEEILPEVQPESLVLKRKERKRRASRVRTDMDEILEQALSVANPTEPAEEEHEPPGKKERKSRASQAKEDESMAEDTFARIMTRDKSTIAEIKPTEAPARERRKSRRSGSRTKKTLDEDSAMVDELALEPVLVGYEEVSNKAQVVTVKDGEGDIEKEKPSRARRRSLRNRDKYPVESKAVPESSPKMPSSAQKKIRKSSR